MLNAFAKTKLNLSRHFPTKQFFQTKTSEQHTATVDLVNFFIFSYRFRLNIETSWGSVVTYFMANGCSANHAPNKHPQRHNVQDVIKIHHNVENVQSLILILGLTDLTWNQWVPKLKSN